MRRFGDETPVRPAGSSNDRASMPALAMSLLQNPELRFFLRERSVHANHLLAFLALAASTASLAASFVSATPARASGPSATPAQAPLFRDVTARSGIVFSHSNGATGTKQYKEVMGSGCCVLDADLDGKLDIYLVNSQGPNALVRNLGGLRFQDVTAAAGVADGEGYGMGAVAADIDNDGDDDLFVTNYGRNRLFRNRGDGTFEEISRELGLDDPRWGAGAAFFDADGDGWLDLYVANYVEQAEPDTNECFGSRGTLRLYCDPRRYPAADDVFYFNRGGRLFEDATEAAGFSGVSGRGLGVMVADLDGDALPDVYVANDLDPNFLFRNRGDGTFEEIGAIAGLAYNEDGVEESGMGLAAGDYDNDGAIDLFVTNFQNEGSTLYHNEGNGFFFDRSAETRVGVESLPFLGWGTRFLDFDLDGWLDLLAVNGHTESDIALVDQLATWKQRCLLHWNRAGRVFEDIAEHVPGLAVPRAGRGAAFADFDDDGDEDFILLSQRGMATLLENANENGNTWVGFRVLDESRKRAAIGTRVIVEFGGNRRVAEVCAGGSYLSGNDPRVVFGLGRWTGKVSVKLVSRHGELALGEFSPGAYHVIHAPESR
jgi:hypothetical protein